MYFIVLDLRLTKKIGCLGEIAFFYEKKSKKVTEEKPQQQSSSSSSSSKKQTKAEKAKKNPFTSESPGKAKGWENKNEREYVKLLLINLFRRQAPDTN